MSSRPHRERPSSRRSRWAATLAQQWRPWPVPSLAAESTRLTMGWTGPDLESAREELGWTTADLAAYARIALPLLEAAERGNGAEPLIVGMAARFLVIEQRRRAAEAALEADQNRLARLRLSKYGLAYADERPAGFLVGDAGVPGFRPNPVTRPERRRTASRPPPARSRR